MEIRSRIPWLDGSASFNGAVILLISPPLHGVRCQSGISKCSAILRPPSARSIDGRCASLREELQE